MEKNVEMKDSTDKKPEAEKKEEVKVPNDKFYELKKNLVLLEKAAKDKDAKMCQTLTK